MDGDQLRGLYGKYLVNRVDGGDQPGRKHADCCYFVLDLDHDVHALPALMAYVVSCQNHYPLLAKDLRKILQKKGVI